jgi:hypothetical protein
MLAGDKIVKAGFESSYATGQKRCHRVGASLARVLLFAAVSIFGTGETVQADALISGQTNAVRIVANGESVTDILVALGRALNLETRTAAALDRTISGVYEGSLRRVIARLLNGYDFFIEQSQGRLRVVVLGQNNPTEKLPLAPTPDPPVI